MRNLPPPAQLDKKLVAEAVSLALHPVHVSDVAATHVLVGLAAGNRTAVRRAIRMVALKLNGEPSHVGQRALDLLRNTLDHVNGQESA
jgi:hypothetical protein